MTNQSIQTEVLVIGGGGAGFRAAVAAREKGAATLLVSKGPLARCGATPMAGADFTLDGKSMNSLGRDGDVNDSMEKVFNDIVTQGFYLNNQKLVEQYVTMAPRLLKDLMDYGIEIKLSDQRMIFTSGTGIMDVLLRKARSVGVDFLEDVMLIDLITTDSRVIAALGLDIRTGEFIVIKAKAIVMATGGWHKAFWPNTGMRDLSGEGIAMACRAGAHLGNMEFITFCCNIMYEPPMWRGSLAPYLISLICGGKLTNSKNKDILEGYDPFMVNLGTLTEWNKSFISYVSTKEIRAGACFSNNGIHYSRGDVPWDYMNMVASFIFPGWKYKSLDLSEWGRMLEANEPIEVGPAVEYFDGGIVINEKCETTLDGLYAAGECALGAFGSNRVFAAITEILVQGLVAGENAALHAAKTKHMEPKQELILNMKQKAESPLTRKTGIAPARVRRDVQQKAHKHLCPIRNAEELSEFINYLKIIKRDSIPRLFLSCKNRIYNKEWIDAIELDNLLFLLEISARSALLRTESRGVHFREDYPYTDNDMWLRESIVKKSENDFETSSRPITVTSMTPPSGSKHYLDMMKMMMQLHSDTGGKH